MNILNKGIKKITLNGHYQQFLFAQKLIYRKIVGPLRNFVFLIRIVFQLENVYLVCHYSDLSHPFNKIVSKKNLTKEEDTV